LLSKEASQEIVLDGIVSLFSKHSKNLEELQQKLTNAFATSSTTSNFNTTNTNVSIRLALGSDTKIINAIINAYQNYTKITPIPKIGLIIDYSKGKITDVSQQTAEIISIGGKVTFAKDQISSYGITNGTTKNNGPLAITLL
jgi:ribonucleoside-triphosphate reductase